MQYCPCSIRRGEMGWPPQVGSRTGLGARRSVLDLVVGRAQRPVRGVPVPAAFVADMLGALSMLHIKFNSKFPNVACLVPKAEIGDFNKGIDSYPRRNETQTAQVGAFLTWTPPFCDISQPVGVLPQCDFPLAIPLRVLRLAAACGSMCRCPVLKFQIGAGRCLWQCPDSQDGISTAIWWCVPQKVAEAQQAQTSKDRQAVLEELSMKDATMVRSPSPLWDSPAPLG